ncbi:hypothetical protein BJY01DRAFT_245348 [Aspergillus pseudoustus]|uniref:Amidohydrolase-related domain-containing protein n=1 Tax=Aspergillus pseudoustus TaxID=1810923 RepID=A0ABR4KEE7_9EURO
MTQIPITSPPSSDTLPYISGEPSTNSDNVNIGEEICILTNLLIPGRGEPQSEMAVGISLGTGKITFVGPQSTLPATLASAPCLHVHSLLPGLWDCHTHFAGTTHVDFPDMIVKNPAVYGAINVRGFYDTLMAGFTSVRDVGSFAIETYEAVKAGLILGPTVYGAGAAIGITGGSCDAVTLPLDFVNSRQGTSVSNTCPGCSTLQLADGPDECRKAVRQQIRRGAKCIKVVATGGILSTSDDPQNRQYSNEELRVLIEEATLQGRAVACHAHGKAGILAAVRAGAHTIEHGSYLDQEAADLMRDRGVTLVATRHVIEASLKHLDKLNPETREKMVSVSHQHLEAYRTAVRTGVKIALGTDVCSSDLKSLDCHGTNGHEVSLAVKAGLTPLQAIEAGTINSAETLGPLTPMKGLIKVGWDADMIALDDNPLENIDVLAVPDKVKYVWQMGKLVKAPGRSFWP